ncbi:hypothetical protein FRB95_009178 [Tulasnella sp. JGI-2019a]|nr:hypothetical protein FRB95_009178 [Tulasnella sp. JGI-2019a]
MGDLTTYDLSKPFEVFMFYQFLTSVKADIDRRTTTLRAMTIAQVEACATRATWKMEGMRPLLGIPASKKLKQDLPAVGTDSNGGDDSNVMGGSNCEDSGEEVWIDRHAIGAEERVQEWYNRLESPQDDQV